MSCRERLDLGKQQPWKFPGVGVECPALLGALDTAPWGQSLSHIATSPRLWACPHGLLEGGHEAGVCPGVVGTEVGGAQGGLWDPCEGKEAQPGSLVPPGTKRGWHWCYESPFLSPSAPGPVLGSQAPCPLPA